jgi:hypothetical protein
LSLVKECYAMNLGLLTNATVVDDAIRFVEEKSFDQRDTKINIRDNERREEDEIQESITTNSIL